MLGWEGAHHVVCPWCCKVPREVAEVGKGKEVRSEQARTSRMGAEVVEQLLGLHLMKLSLEKSEQLRARKC